MPFDGSSQRLETRVAWQIKGLTAASSRSWEASSALQGPPGALGESSDGIAPRRRVSIPPLKATPTDGPPGMVFRPGKPADLATVANAVLAEKMNPLGLEMARFVVAEEAESGRVLGFGQLKPWETLSEKQGLRGRLVRGLGLTPNWKGELVELSSLVVDKQSRGKGIGSALVRELVSRAEGKALCLITIGASVPFYERLGFQEISPEEVPRPLQPEVALGTVVARLAVDDRVLCMAYGPAIDSGLISTSRGPGKVRN